jgi:CheY-like chemotaxis protein
MRRPLGETVVDHGPIRPASPDAPGDHDHEVADDRLRGARILLVEDNPTNREIALAFLERFGADVTIAADGLAAVEIATHARFDAILMDLQMPVMDGFEANRQLRERLGAGCPPVIALSASAMIQDRQACLTAGMVDHLAKPVVREELRDILLRWVRRNPAPHSTETDRARPTDDACPPPTLPGVAPDMGSEGSAGPSQASFSPSGGGPGIARPRGPSEASAGPSQASFSSGTTGIDLDALLDQLADLERMLERNLLSARQVSDVIEQQLAGTDAEAAFRPIAEAVRKLKFRPAASMLQSFIRNLPRETGSGRSDEQDEARQDRAGNNASVIADMREGMSRRES